MVSSRHAQVCFHWIFKFQSLTFAFVQPLTNFYSRDFIAARNLFVVCFRSEKNYFFLGTGNISVWHPFYISKRTHKFQCRAERVFHVILFEPQVKNHGLKIIIFSSHLEFPPIAWFAKSGCLNRLQSVSVASLLLGVIHHDLCKQIAVEILLNLRIYFLTYHSKFVTWVGEARRINQLC